MEKIMEIELLKEIIKNPKPLIVFAVCNCIIRDLYENY